jgi:alpha-tubulin suppressor-like RCC1 family protein
MSFCSSGCCAARAAIVFWIAVLATVVACEKKPLGPGARTFTSVSAGWLYTCGVTIDGAALCWVSNTAGQLGNGSSVSSPTAVAVAGGLTFSAVSTDTLHGCGQTASGATWCWGDGVAGELGNGTMNSNEVPVAVSGL